MTATLRSDWRCETLGERAAFSWEVGSGRFRSTDAVGEGREPYQQPLLTRHKPLLEVTGASKKDVKDGSKDTG